MPKLSRYNHLQVWQNEGYLFYNALSGAVATMSGDNYEVYRRITKKLEEGADPELDEEERKLLDQMLYGKYACPEECDEIGDLRFRHNMDRYGQAALGLTIAPTLACNMACVYCYEDNKRGKMTPEVVEAVEGFVKKRAAVLGQLSVSWYGGEPLLAVDVIEDLSGRFMKLAEENDFFYSASMISNGYLLTPEMVDRLVPMKIGGVQVTVDGPARVHDAQRPLKNGKPSYYRILENLDYAAGKMNVVIRVNIDKSSSGEVVAELLGELKEAGLAEKIRLNFGRIEPATQVCSNIAESCYETYEYSQAEIEYYTLMLENGFSIDKLPSPTSTACMAQSVGSFLVDPDGDLARCFNHVGNKSLTIGNVRDDIDYQHPNFMHLFRFDPFHDETCSQCNLLPICMGGCPSQRADRKITGEEACPSWKHNLQPMLELIARSRMRQIQKQQEAAAAAKE